MRVHVLYVQPRHREAPSSVTWAGAHRIALDLSLFMLNAEGDCSTAQPLTPAIKRRLLSAVAPFIPTASLRVHLQLIIAADVRDPERAAVEVLDRPLQHTGLGVQLRQRLCRLLHVQHSEQRERRGGEEVVEGGGRGGDRPLLVVKGEVQGGRRHDGLEEKSGDADDLLEARGDGMERVKSASRWCGDRCAEGVGADGLSMSARSTQRRHREVSALGGGCRCVRHCQLRRGSHTERTDDSTESGGCSAFKGSATFRLPSPPLHHLSHAPLTAVHTARLLAIRDLSFSQRQ